MALSLTPRIPTSSMDRRSANTATAQQRALPMTIAERIATRVAVLPVARQAEVLDFVEFLAARQRSSAAVDWTESQFMAMSLEQLFADDDPVAYDLADCREAI